MFPQLALRVLRTTDPRLLWKFSWNFGWKGMRSVQKFKQRLGKGEFFPPFLYVSVINSCNLRCQGCYAISEEKGDDMPFDTMAGIVQETVRMGATLITISAGIRPGRTSAC